jgi:hypothetical protein
MGPTLKNGLLELETLNVPLRNIKPGNAFEVDIAVKNRALQLPFDPDNCYDDKTQCRPGTAEPNGYCTHFHVMVEGNSGIESQADGFTCANKAFLPGTANRTEITMTLIAPELPEDVESRNYDVTSYIELPQTGVSSNGLTETITVAQDVTTPPDNGGGGGDGGGDGGLPSGQDLTNIAYILGIAWGLSSVADLFGDD